MSAPGFSHRASLKQTNKGFKSRHATKSSLKALSKGRPASISSVGTSSSSKSLSTSGSHTEKKNRLNSLKQKRTARLATVNTDVKLFSTASGGGSVPRIVAVVPLHPSVSAVDFTSALLPALGLSESEHAASISTLADLESTKSSRGSLLLPAPKYKSSLQVSLLPPTSLYATLDACLSADYVVLLMSSTEEVEEEGERILRCLQSVIGGGGGGAEVVACVQAPEDNSLNPQSRPGILKSLLSFTTYFFPSVQKVHVCPPVPSSSSSSSSSSAASSDASNLARSLCEGLPAGMSHAANIQTGSGKGRDTRGYVVAEVGDCRTGSQEGEAVRFEVNHKQSEKVEGEESEEEEVKGTLIVRGTVRGGRLSADRLVHIPGWGDYQISQILAAPLPTSRRAHAKQMAIDSPAAVGEPLSVPSDAADDLVALNDPDFMGNEQTWPTEEEMAGYDQSLAEAGLDGQGPGKNGVVSKPAEIRRVPKGTSAYQAAWILDEDDGEDGEDDIEEENEEDEMEMDEAGKAEGSVRFAGGETGEETEEIDMESRQTERYDDLDEEEEERQLQEYRKNRGKENEDDLHFPDEVDTPRNIPASVRFARYRGLKSFRTSPWDPYEDLPVDYAKIFQFEDYERTRRRIEAAGREEGIEAGTRVEVHVKDVPQALFDARDPSLPFVLFGLLQHEHKQSVLHFAVQRNTEYTEPVKAKEPLILCVGPRRYRIRPIYSQHTRGGGKGVNNVHKSERYLRHGGAVVATTYGPVCFGKQSCILLRESEDPEVPHLVAMGSFMNADPTRINAKRIVLSGAPFKVHKRIATIRYMFFNREDIEYFAPIELHTKFGRMGHIKEALGTHGYFKAHFDGGGISQADTVLMTLYKRQHCKPIEDFVPPQVGRFEKVEDGDEENGDEMDVEQ